MRHFEPVRIPVPPRPPRPGGRHRPAIAAWITAVLSVAAACSGHAATGAGGLLVAGGGPLQETDANGALVPFEGFRDPVVVVSSSLDRIVVATTDGRVLASVATSADRNRTWATVPSPHGPTSAIPLLSLSPTGQELAVAVGDLQAETFELVVVDLSGGGRRSIPVPAGLNGPPTWIGPAAVAIDTIRPGGASGLTLIDVPSATVTDVPGESRIVTATSNGKTVAIDTPRGDVLVIDAAMWRAGRRDGMVRIAAIARTGIDGLAISPDGTRLAVIRRTDAGRTSIDLYTLSNRSRALIDSLATNDGPAISMAWLS